MKMTDSQSPTATQNNCDKVYKICCSFIITLYMHLQLFFLSTIATYRLSHRKGFFFLRGKHKKVVILNFLNFLSSILLPIRSLFCTLILVPNLTPYSFGIYFISHKKTTLYIRAFTFQNVIIFYFIILKNYFINYTIPFYNTPTSQLLFYNTTH